jgi:hypothetical protein
MTDIGAACGLAHARMHGPNCLGQGVKPGAKQFVERSADGQTLARSEISGVRFVPLLGQFGHAEA